MHLLTPISQISAQLFPNGKFTPNEGIEVGTQLTFGFLNETASNFSFSRSVANIAWVPTSGIDQSSHACSDIKSRYLSWALDSLSLSEQFEVNKQFHIGFLKGYAGGSIVLDGQGIWVINHRWVAYRI